MKPIATGPERLRDAASGVVLLFFTFILWFVLIPDYAGGHGEHVIVAEIAAILIGGLALLLIVLAGLGIPSASGSAVDDDPFLAVGEGREPPKLYLLGGIWGLYVIGLSFLGFYLCGAFAVVASMWLLGLRRPLLLAGCTAAALLGSYLVFEWGFRLTLPRGAWILALLSGG